MAAELAAVTAAEIYSPDPNNPTKTLQIWNTLITFISFVSQILLQFFRITPSLLSAVGIRQYSLISPTFKPIPSDETTPPPPPIPKLTIVLDLDETLVCAYERFYLPDVVKSHAIDAGVKCFEIECLSIEMDDEGRPKVNHVTVFERPGLREFLMKISEFADLVLFTAGLEGYARPLVDRIDVDKKFGLRLYRPSTVNTEYREHVKDLTCLSKDLCRTVIVDNNPFSFLLQPLNGIPCAPFSAAEPYDEQLLDVILPLLKFLSSEKDVRLALYEKFHMPEWFQEHGIPTAPH